MTLWLFSPDKESFPASTLSLTFFLFFSVWSSLSFFHSFACSCNFYDWLEINPSSFFFPPPGKTKVIKSTNFDCGLKAISFSFSFTPQRLNDFIKGERGESLCKITPRTAVKMYHFPGLVAILAGFFCFSHKNLARGIISKLL